MDRHGVFVVGVIVLGAAAAKWAALPNKPLVNQERLVSSMFPDECESLYTGRKGRCAMVANMDATEFKTRARAKADLNEFCTTTRNEADKTICAMLKDADYDGFKKNSSFNRESGLWN